MTTPRVEKPGTAEELARILHECETARHSVVPLGGGKAMGMGNAVARCDVTLSTARLDRVL